MCDEYKICCRKCEYCIIVPDYDFASKNGILTIHSCLLDRPEYDYYDGDCICYKEKVTKYE